MQVVFLFFMNGAYMERVSTNCFSLDLPRVVLKFVFLT